MKRIKYALCALALMACFNAMAQNEISFGNKLIIRDYEAVDKDGKVEYNTSIKVAKKNYTIRLFDDEDKIYGLGSNDDGASVVSMIAAFRYHIPSQASSDSSPCGQEGFISKFIKRFFF